MNIKNIEWLVDSVWVASERCRITKSQLEAAQSEDLLACLALDKARKELLLAVENSTRPLSEMPGVVIVAKPSVVEA